MTRFPTYLLIIGLAVAGTLVFRPLLPHERSCADLDAPGLRRAAPTRCAG